jgi:23S rRNA U2552 (ribose-2'-O)-methylase RlmE/FtsJ
MTHSPSASSGPRLPFAFARQVTVWDPIQRHLEIGRSPVGWLRVSVDRLAAGVRVNGRRI